MRNQLFALLALLLAGMACSLPGGDSDGPVQNSAPGDLVATAPPTEAVLESSAAAEGACSHPYYPIKQDASWTYQLSGQFPDTFTRTILAASADGFTDQDVFGAGTIRTGEWRCENGNLISLTPGGGTSATVAAGGDVTEFTTLSNKGISIGADFSAGQSWSQEIQYEGSQDISGTIITSNNTVTINCAVVGEEAVTVPAGTFQTVRVDCTNQFIIKVQGNEIVIDGATTSWFAQGVGMVKSDGAGGGYDALIELTAYQIP